jgi:hypothetical protein
VLLRGLRKLYHFHFGQIALYKCETFRISFLFLIELLYLIND